MRIFVLGLALMGFSVANADCRTSKMAGRWLFATDIGHQMLLPGGNITALGTMRIDRRGNLSGVFDATVQDWMHLPAVKYTGKLTVRRDCTGTLRFVTEAGTERTDSIAVVEHGTFPGHVTGSQQPLDVPGTSTEGAGAGEREPVEALAQRAGRLLAN